ncbi:hypothetical protein KFE25_000495 [Diacronema lutheri]|mgnify:CR=1 FL=1|uniref:Gamma-secretase subunit PEN-2 n=1 Tax=Diacronema lutheri TaxID=2081491 RepID=A0A8J5XVB8_DIALT|nr:hypothetical protein KFE25_000495 [Diacronema lutheri]
MRVPESADAEEDARRAERAHELRECKLLFFAGFLGLPWLWFVNWFHYRRRAPPESDPLVQVYARRSLLGSIIGLVLFLVYFFTVQLTWRRWATDIMINAPARKDEF